MTFGIIRYFLRGWMQNNTEVCFYACLLWLQHVCSGGCVLPIWNDKLRHQLQQKITALWNVTPCNLVFKYRRFVEIRILPSIPYLEKESSTFLWKRGLSGQSPSQLRHKHTHTHTHIYIYIYTGCGRNNSHILKVNKNQTKQGTQKILLFMKSTYDAIFSNTFKVCRPLLMTKSWSRSRKLRRRTSPWNYWTIKGDNTTRNRRHSAPDDPQSHGQLPWKASRFCHQ